MPVTLAKERTTKTDSRERALQTAHLFAPTAASPLAIPALS